MATLSKIETVLAYAQDAEIQAELNEAYHNESLVDDYNDGLAMISADVFFQVKHAHGEDMSVYKLEVFELDDVFEQAHNCPKNIFEDMKHTADIYFAERTQLLDFIDHSVRKNHM